MRLAWAVGLLGVLVASGCLLPRRQAVQCGDVFCPAGSSCKDGGGCLCNTVEACGEACQACQPPSNATPRCEQGSCAFDCNPGFCPTRLGDECKSMMDDPDNCGSCGNSCDSRVCIRGTCGPAPVEVVSTTLPAGLALAVGGEALYVANAVVVAEGGQIIRVTLPNTIDRLQNRDEPIGVAVDAESVYWTEKNSGGIFKAPLSLAGSPTTLTAGQSAPYDIALDNQNVYWTNEGGSEPNSGSVFGISKTGAGFITLAVSQGTPHGLVVDGGMVYWANRNEGAVRTTPSAGGGNITLIRSGLNAPEALAAYQGAVYVTTASTISRVTGTNRRDIVTDQNRPARLVFDNGFVYWTNGGTGSSADGSVMRMSLSGNGSPEVLARGGRWAMNPWSIVVDAQNVYWTTYTRGGAVWRLPK